MKSFKLFSSVPDLYKNMIDDIRKAKSFIYLETYIYDNDRIGLEFKNELIKKAKEGVKVCLLVDGWGSTVNKDFFHDLIAENSEVRLFREFQYFIRIFSKNHERNHRKLLIIDNDICYIGSANITEKCLNYRELTIKLSGPIVKYFIAAFNQTWEIYGKLTKKRIKSFFYKEYEILQDFPSYYHRITEKKLKKMIRKAKKNILIETPYFVPSPEIMKGLKKAVNRKVDVTLILPFDSEVRIVDIFRNSYLGKLYLEGIKIYYYRNSMLHTKLMIVDDEFFMFGSSNLDYRSFLHQFEINVFGKNRQLIKALKNYFNETLENSIPFDYGRWKNRSSVTRLMEILLSTIKEYL